MKNKKKVTYVITSEYKTNNFTDDKLVRIFNEKYFKTIMKIENFFNSGDVWNGAL